MGEAAGAEEARRVSEEAAGPRPPFRPAAICLPVGTDPGPRQRTVAWVWGPGAARVTAPQKRRAPVQEAAPWGGGSEGGHGGAPRPPQGQPPQTRSAVTRVSGLSVGSGLPSFTSVVRDGEVAISVFRSWCPQLMAVLLRKSPSPPDPPPTMPLFLTWTTLGL